MNRGIIKKIYRSKDIENIQNKIDMLGSDRKINFDATVFITARIITTIILILFLVFLTNTKYYIIPFIIVIYYYLFYYIFITNPLNKRIRKLDNEALIFFEILALTLESGKNLENSLDLVSSSNRLDILLISESGLTIPNTIKPFSSKYFAVLLPRKDVTPVIIAIFLSLLLIIIFIIFQNYNLRII